MNRLLSIMAVGVEGLLGALVTHRPHESLGAHLLSTALTVLPTASILAGWLLARGAARSIDDFVDQPPGS